VGGSEGEAETMPSTPRAVTAMEKEGGEDSGRVGKAKSVPDASRRAFFPLFVA